MSQIEELKGLEKTLREQLNKLDKHNRQGSKETQKRYRETCTRFLRHLARNFHLRKLNNISGKHLVSYVEYMQKKGLAASTIKTELSGIRFFHDKMDAKYRLPSNDQLGIELERRRFGGVDRTWTPPEFNRLLMIALFEGRDDYILAFYLARYGGLRVHECFHIDTAIAEDALREGAITIKGKGGKVRTVPINEQISIAQRETLRRTKRGHKLLMPDDMPTSSSQAPYPLLPPAAKARSFRCSSSPQNPLREFRGPLFCPIYAAEKYQALIAAGKNELDAHLAVFKLLGHERPDVTNIYLASARKGGRLGD